MPVTLSGLLNAEPVSRRSHTGYPTKDDEGRPTAGIVQPDDALLRLGYFAPKYLNDLQSEKSPLAIEKKRITDFRSEVQNLKPMALDSLLPPEVIIEFKKVENSAFSTCEEACFHPETTQEVYIPILKRIINEYRNRTPAFVKRDALAVAKFKDQSNDDDIASTQRSIWMFHTVAKWAAKMNPTIFKVGGEHVDDMKTAMQLPTSIPENTRRIRIVTDKEVQGQFKAENPEAVKEIDSIKKKTSSQGAFVMRPKGLPGKKAVLDSKEDK
jgi:hypothetical protein